VGMVALTDCRPSRGPTSLINIWGESMVGEGLSSMGWMQRRCVACECELCDRDALVKPQAADVRRRRHCGLAS
jgi:hypothetical protein